MRLAPLLAIALTACVQTNAALIDSSIALAPICPEGVQLFTASAQVGKPYREVAILQSIGEAAATTEVEMYNSQRKKAAALGANGVIIRATREPLPDSTHVVTFFGPNPRRTVDAMAVLIPEDSVRVRAACGTRRTENRERRTENRE
jgi:hypothetical protein